MERFPIEDVWSAAEKFAAIPEHLRDAEAAHQQRLAEAGAARGDLAAVRTGAVFVAGLALCAISAMDAVSSPAPAQK